MILCCIRSGDGASPQSRSSGFYINRQSDDFDRRGGINFHFARNPPDISPSKKELPMESSLEQMRFNTHTIPEMLTQGTEINSHCFVQLRLAIQLQGVSKSLKSLEERFSVTQSRLTRNEKTSQQALAQARCRNDAKCKC